MIDNSVIIYILSNDNVSNPFKLVPPQRKSISSTINANIHRWGCLLPGSLLGLLHLNNLLHDLLLLNKESTDYTQANAGGAQDTTVRAVNGLLVLGDELVLHRAKARNPGKA